jgi:hypothetical protein
MTEVLGWVSSATAGFAELLHERVLTAFRGCA